MRLFTLAMAAAMPGLVAGQGGITLAVHSLGKFLGPKGPLPAQGAKPPGQGLQPARPPILSEQDQRLPAQNPDASQILRVIEGGDFVRQGDIVQAFGKIHMQYKGYDLYAQRIDGNLRTNIFVLTGGAQVVGLDAIFKGERIEIDFDRESFVAQNIWAEIRPGLLKGRTKEDVYLWGKEFDGTRAEIHTHDGGLTTCNLEHPHFRLNSRSITIRPNKRVILRNTGVEVLGRTIFRVPYLSIPIENRRENFTPEVGQSQEAGYFVKTRWGVPAAGKNDLNAYLDYFQKLGTGYGGRLDYDSGKYDGYLKTYALAGQDNSLELISEHKQQIGVATLSMTNNFQRNNFFNAPDNTTLNTRMQLLLPQGRDTTRLSYFRYSNESTSFSSVNQTVGLVDQRQFGSKTKTTLDLKWTQSHTDFSTSSSTEREQVDVRFRGQQDFGKGLAELEYLRSIPVGETANFFGSSDRTPVLALKSDSRRLFGDSFGGAWPFQAELSFGEFANPAAKDRVTRTFFDFNLNRPDRSKSRLGLAFGGRFRQGIYSDDTAQFALGLNSTLRYSLAEKTGLNVRFNYLKPEGFTPLAIDRTGETDIISGDLSTKLSRSFLIGVQSGYDFLRVERGEPTPWQQVGVRMEWRPSEQFQLRAYTSYDPTQRAWTNLRFDMAYAQGNTFLNVGGRYDGLRKTWGAINIYTDGIKLGRTTLTAFAAYNGFLKQFESIQYAIVYDLHCWEAVLQVAENNVGFRPGRQVFLFFRLKAFPYQPSFGTGTRGQPLGTGTGFGY